MFPAPAVDGCVVPGGMMPWRQLRLGCHPPGLFDRLKALPGFNPREMLDMELEVKAIEGCPEDELADWVERHIVREGRWRSEEHTSELQSRQYLVCRLLLEKKKIST